MRVPEIECWKEQGGTDRTACEALLEQEKFDGRRKGKKSQLEFSNGHLTTELVAGIEYLGTDKRTDLRRLER